MSYANGLSPFRGKINGYLLPVDHFKRRALKNISSPVEHKLTYKKEKIYDNKSLETEKNVHVTSVNKSSEIKIESPNQRKGVSSLSLSSIKVKKEANLKSFNKKTIVNNAEDKFTQEKLLELFQGYIEIKNLQGENNIAALLEMGRPELYEDFMIIIRTSSSLSQIEIKKEIPAILSYLGKKLNNYKIKFDIQIEEREKKEYIFGIKEKYDHLMKINPEIEVLKNEFNLDL
jgi:hypothetical protein